jgi:hypothetical protein
MSAMTGEAASCRPSAQDDGCPGAANALAALISKAPIATAQARKRENTGICITAPVPLERSDVRIQKFSDFAHARIGKPVPFFRDMRFVWSWSRLPAPAPNRRYRDSPDAPCCR